MIRLRALVGLFNTQQEPFITLEAELEFGELAL